MRFTKTLLALVLVAPAVTIGCGGSSPVGPSPTGSIASATPTSGPVMAPPPAGVSSAMWKNGFFGDELLRRPSAIHIVLPPDLDEATRTLYADVAQRIVGFEGTPMDLIPNPNGTDNFQVSMVPGSCGGFAACTGRVYDASGRVTGGTITFTSETSMRNRFAVMHELIHALGVTGHSSMPGIMAPGPWSELRPNDEELRMLVGRRTPPLLAKYSPGL